MFVLFVVPVQQQQRLIQMQRNVVPNRMISVSQQIIQQGAVQQTVQQTRQLAPPPPYPGPPPPYPGQHQVKLNVCLVINYFFCWFSNYFDPFSGLFYFAFRYFVEFQKSMPFFIKYFTKTLIN